MSEPTGDVIRPDSPRPSPEWAFWLGLGILGGFYVVLIVAMIVADLFYTSPGHLLSALANPDIRFSIILSLASCTITTILSLWVGIPLGYLMSRAKFFGKGLVDTILDIPIVLPPLVIGLSLLILFRTSIGQAIESVFPITYQWPSVILAQFAVAAAFAVRTMRITFDQISPRTEQVAMTLGCSRHRAFWRVVLPQAGRGILTAATLSWSRSLGEFGPILIFSGATPQKTEVLPTTVFLQLSIGNLEAALAVSLLMIFVAAAVLVLTRWLGLRGTGLL